MLSEKYKRDPDNPITSAKILINEATEGATNPKVPPLYMIQPVAIPARPGFVVIAFCLPESLRRFGGILREISLDSACTSYLGYT
jgi:hypothetical protein